MDVSCENMPREPVERPRRRRQQVSRALFGDKRTDSDKALELDDVLTILTKYGESREGGMNCWVCGKLYKSRVCYIKHLWEHSAYWDVFSGGKNHERVLSIQAALILWSWRCDSRGDDCGSDTGGGGEDKRPNSRDKILSLLVTSPHKKEPDEEEKTPLGEVKEADMNILPATDNRQDQATPIKRPPPVKRLKQPQKSFAKRRLLTTAKKNNKPVLSETDIESPAKVMRQC